MGEVFITRKGGGGKAATPTLAVTSVGGSFVQLAVTNNDQTNQATIFLLANYDINSATDFDILAAQSGTVINVAANTTVSTIVSGLDPDTSHTVSAQAAVIKKLPSNIITTDTINLAGTGVTAPTVGPITVNNFTSTTFTVTNNDTVVSQIIKANITESTTVPSVYPFESSTLAALATESITVSGLTQATVYYIHARAFDGAFSSSNVVFGPYTQSSPIVATGGTITNQTIGGIDYRIHRFNSNGTLSVTSVPTGLTGYDTVEVLLVGGGGAGGFNAGGGGGGGAVIRATTALSAINHGVTVGAGGAKRNVNDSYSNPASIGGTGGTSSSFTINSTGGGGGGFYSTTANVGGGASGANGGGSGDSTSGSGMVGGSGVAPTLPAGVTGTVFAGNSGSNPLNGSHSGGGGGGAGASATNTIDGGVGAQDNILGTNFFFGGGGGCGTWAKTRAGNGGSGGGGGGGNGQAGSPGTGGTGGLVNGTNGSSGAPNVNSGGNAGTNTGGGGGGGSFWSDQGSRGGNGGSGIVVIRYVVGGTV